MQLVERFADARGPDKRAGQMPTAIVHTCVFVHPTCPQRHADFVFANLGCRCDDHVFE